MKNVKMLLASAAVVAISATAASAVVIDFGQQGTVEPGSASISVGGSSGYTITATGGGVSGSAIVPGLVTRTGSPVNGPNQGGLGIKSLNDTNQSIDGGISGNSPFKDILLLTFTQAVKIVSVSFSLVKEDRFGPDHANITVDGSALGNFAIANFGFPAFMPTGGWVGTVFGFGALGQNDEYKLRAIEVTPVPVPPAALLLATGVAGIGALARRRAKKA